MRAPGEPLIVEQVEVDQPGPDEVVIRVVAAGVCHSDLVFLEGGYPHPLPAVLGHESAGMVTAVGADVAVVAPGDHVITSLSASCGVCVYCAAGDLHLCDQKHLTRRGPGEPPRLARAGETVHQFLELSSFAEEMLVHQSTVVKVPPDAPLDRAALLGCGVATGLGAVFNTAGVRAGESVAVIGCGGVGLAAVQGARIAGADPIIALDVSPSKLELAARLGATHMVDPGQRDPVAGVKEITGGHGVHHSIEAIGRRDTAQMAFAALRRGGTATIVGLIPGETLSLPTDELFYERRAQGSVMGSNRPRRDIPRYVEMYLDGRLNLDDMITRRISLEDLNRAFDDMREHKAVRSLVMFD